ncbi:MAG: hypothetical protein GXY49_10705 [Syntrophomonadaceae bacterium]|nr:hypothetical protein [Syntrophomonadaceae bacterium]
MTVNKAPYIRVFILLAAVVMLFFAPTREFLKITFFLGIPFLLFYVLMSRQIRYSLPWFICGILVLGVIGLYGYMLVHLPQRVEVREIIREGGTLVAEGKYDHAIEEYQRLEKLGQAEKMEEKISLARQEQQAAQQLEQARQKLAQGDKQAAREIIANIEPGTRAAVEARDLRKQLGL